MITQCCRSRITGPHLHHRFQRKHRQRFDAATRYLLTHVPVQRRFQLCNLQVSCCLLHRGCTGPGNYVGRPRLRGCEPDSCGIPERRRIGGLRSGNRIPLPGQQLRDSRAPRGVETAQRSTTDATIFINASNTVSGTLTFSCSGLPAFSNCTFSPTSIPLTAGSTYAGPVYTDMTAVD